MFGIVNFANGAIGQWVFHYAGHGLPFNHRMVFGTRGSIAAPGDRNGNPVRLVLDDGTDICDERVLEYAPGYRLSPVAADLFGGERVWSYDFDFVTTDRKIVALEYHEFAECIRTRRRARGRWRGRAPRRRAGLRALRVAAAGRPVTIEEVESGAVDAYQREIDEHLGLIAKQVS